MVVSVLKDFENLWFLLVRVDNLVFLLVLVKHCRIAYCFGLNDGFGIALCLSNF